MLVVFCVLGSSSFVSAFDPRGDLGGDLGEGGRGYGTSEGVFGGDNDTATGDNASSDAGETADNGTGAGPGGDGSGNGFGGGNDGGPGEGADSSDVSANESGPGDKDGGQDGNGGGGWSETAAERGAEQPTSGGGFFGGLISAVKGTVQAVTNTVQAVTTAVSTMVDNLPTVTVEKYDEDGQVNEDDVVTVTYDDGTSFTVTSNAPTLEAGQLMTREEFDFRMQQIAAQPTGDFPGNPDGSVGVGNAHVSEKETLAVHVQPAVGPGYIAAISSQDGLAFSVSPKDIIDGINPEHRTADTVVTITHTHPGSLGNGAVQSAGSMPPSAPDMRLDGPMGDYVSDRLGGARVDSTVIDAWGVFSIDTSESKVDLSKVDFNDFDTIETIEDDDVYNAVIDIYNETPIYGCSAGGDCSQYSQEEIDASRQAVLDAYAELGWNVSYAPSVSIAPSEESNVSPGTNASEASTPTVGTGPNVDDPDPAIDSGDSAVEEDHPEGSSDFFAFNKLREPTIEKIECSSDNTQVRLTWREIPQAPTYALRINDPVGDHDGCVDDWYCGTRGEYLGDLLTEEVFVRDIVPGKEYVTWVHAKYRDTWEGLSDAPHVRFTCSADTLLTVDEQAVDAISAGSLDQDQEIVIYSELPKPTNIAAVCDSGGTEVTLTWDGVLQDSTFFATRFNEVGNDDPSCAYGWHCEGGVDAEDNNYTQNQNTFAINPDVKYQFWVHQKHGGTWDGISEESEVRFTCSDTNAAIAIPDIAVLPSAATPASEPVNVVPDPVFLASTQDPSDDVLTPDAVVTDDPGLLGTIGDALAEAVDVVSNLILGTESTDPVVDPVDPVDPVASVDDNRPDSNESSQQLSIPVLHDVVCAPGGTSATLEWDPVDGAIAYALRINDLHGDDDPSDVSGTCTDDWYCDTGIDTLDDAYAGTKFVIEQMLPETEYEFWVHAKHDESWDRVSDPAEMTFSCPVGVIDSSVAVGFNDLMILGSAMESGYQWDELAENSTAIPSWVTEEYVKVLAANNVAAHREIVPAAVLADDSQYSAMAKVVRSFESQNMILMLALGRPSSVSSTGDASCIIPDSLSAWQNDSRKMAESLGDFVEYLRDNGVSESWITNKLIIDPWNEFETLGRGVNTGGGVCSQDWLAAGSPQYAVALRNAIVSVFQEKSLGSEITAPSLAGAYEASTETDKKDLQHRGWLGDYYNVYGGGGRPNIHIYFNPTVSSYEKLVHYEKVIEGVVEVVPERYKNNILMGETSVPVVSDTCRGWWEETDPGWGATEEERKELLLAILGSPLTKEHVDLVIFWRLFQLDTVDGFYPCNFGFTDSVNWEGVHNFVYSGNAILDALGGSGSRSISLVNPYTKLDTPQNLAYTCNDDSSEVTLSWNEVTDAEEYTLRIEPLLSTHGSERPIHFVDKEFTDYTHDNIIPGISYEWWTEAKYKDTWEGISTETKTPFSCRMEAPTMSHTCNGDGTVTMNWSDTGADVYPLRLQPIGGVEVAVNDKTSTSHTFNITEGTQYQWWVHSIRDNNWDGASIERKEEFVCESAETTVEDTAVDTFESASEQVVVIEQEDPGLIGRLFGGSDTRDPLSMPEMDEVLCIDDGTTAVLTWSGVPDDQTFVLGIDDLEGNDDPLDPDGTCVDDWDCGGKIDTYDNAYDNSFYYIYNVEPGKSYQWWVHAKYKDTWDGVSDSIKDTFVCEAPEADIPVDPEVSVVTQLLTTDVQHVASEFDSGKVGEFEIHFEMTPYGDKVYVSDDLENSAEAMAFTMLDSQGGSAAGIMTSSLDSSAQKIDGLYEINEGDTEVFRLKGVLETGQAGEYTMQISSVPFFVGSSDGAIATVDVQDFITPSLSITNSENVQKSSDVMSDPVPDSVEDPAGETQSELSADSVVPIEDPVVPAEDPAVPAEDTGLFGTLLDLVIPDEPDPVPALSALIAEDVECSPDGTQATLRWERVGDPHTVALRINDPADDRVDCEPGWFCGDNPIEENDDDYSHDFYYLFDIVPDKEYEWWAHAKNEDTWVGLSPLVGSTFSCPAPVVEVLGCTDVNATNHNPDATEDNGSCEYPLAALSEPVIKPYECDPSGTEVKLLWNPVDNAQVYALRVSRANGSGEIIIPDSADLFHDYTLLPDVEYRWWVHAKYGPSWDGASAQTYHTVSCPAPIETVPTQPTIPKGTTLILKDGVQYQNVANRTEDWAHSRCTSYINAQPDKAWECSWKGTVFNSYTPPVVTGCTDVNAGNYEAEATQDDGSCVAPVVTLVEPGVQDVECNAEGTKATLRWDPVPHVETYALRVDDPAGNNSDCTDGWYCGTGKDFLSDTVGNREHPVIGIIPDKEYTWWVHAKYNSSWDGASSKTERSFSCPTPQEASGLFGTMWDALTPDPDPIPALTEPVVHTYECDPSGTEVTLSWNSVDDSHSYAVRIDDPVGNSTNCTDDWLCGPEDYENDVYTRTSIDYPITPGKEYMWWVHAKNEDTWIGASPKTPRAFSCSAPVISGCTDANATNHNPDATEDNGSCEYPLGILPQPQMNPHHCLPNNEVTLSWNEVTDAEEYTLRIEPVLSTYGPERPINFVDKADTDYTYDNIIPGIKYNWWTEAKYKDTWDGLSSQTKTPFSCRLAAPTLTHTCNGDGTVTLNWNSVPGADNYPVRIQPLGGAEIAVDERGTSRTFNITEGVSYQWWVHAMRDDNWDGASVEDKVTFVCEGAPVLGCTDTQATTYNLDATQDDGSCVYPLTQLDEPQVQEPECTAGGTQVNLRWNEVAADTDITYALRIDDPEGNNSSCRDEWLCGPEDYENDEHTLRYRYVYNITPGKTYNWWVHAKHFDTWEGISTKTPRTFTCDAPVIENAEVTIKKSPDSPDASSIQVDDTDTTEATVLVFEVEESNGVGTTVENIQMRLTSDTSITSLVESVELYQNGSQVASASVTGTSIQFTNVDVDIPADGKVDLEVKAVIKSITLVQSGSTIEVDIVSVTGLDEQGATITAIGAVSGDTHNVLLAGPVVYLNSIDETTNTPVYPSDDGSITYTFDFDVTAVGDDIYIPQLLTVGARVGSNDGFAGYSTPRVTGAQAFTASVESSASQTNGFYKIEEGDTDTFTIEIELRPSESDAYRMRLAELRYNTYPSNSGSKVLSLPSDDFISDSMVYTAVDPVPTVTFNDPSWRALADSYVSSVRTSEFCEWKGHGEVVDYQLRDAKGEDVYGCWESEGTDAQNCAYCSQDPWSTNGCNVVASVTCEENENIETETFVDPNWKSVSNARVSSVRGQAFCAWKTGGEMTDVEVRDAKGEDVYGCWDSEGAGTQNCAPCGSSVTDCNVITEVTCVVPGDIAYTQPENTLWDKIVHIFSKPLSLANVVRSIW